jgi:hypothetical protein
MEEKLPKITAQSPFSFKGKGCGGKRELQPPP